MRKSKTRKIGEDSITIQQWGALKAAQNMLILGRLLGEFVAVIAEAKLSQRAANDATPWYEGIDLGRVAKSLFDNAKAEDVTAFLLDLQESTTAKRPNRSADGSIVEIEVRPFEVDSFFAGRPTDLITFFLFGVEVNYADFFPAGTLSQASPGTNASSA